VPARLGAGEVCLWGVYCVWWRLEGVLCAVYASMCMRAINVGVSFGMWPLHVASTAWRCSSSNWLQLLECVGVDHHTRSLCLCLHLLRTTSSVCVRFIRSEDDDAADSWEVRLARRYYR
jgi:hypothetical protein